MTATTFKEAEKLVQVEMTLPHLAQAASNWRMQMAPLYERRTGPRKMALETGVGAGDGVESHASGCSASAKPMALTETISYAARTRISALPANEDDIAFASVAQLSRWIEARQITSVRLTEIYLRRHRTIRSETALRDHADTRTRSGSGAPSRC